MHYYWDLEKLQERNGWTDDERRKRSSAIINDLHKEIPELLKWHESSKGFNYPQVEFGKTDKDGFPLVIAVRKLTHQPKEIEKLVIEIGERHLKEGD